MKCPYRELRECNRCLDVCCMLAAIRAAPEPRRCPHGVRTDFEYCWDCGDARIESKDWGDARFEANYDELLRVSPLQQQKWLEGKWHDNHVEPDGQEDVLLRWPQDFGGALKLNVGDVITIKWQGLLYGCLNGGWVRERFAGKVVNEWAIIPESAWNSLRYSPEVRKVRQTQSWEDRIAQERNARLIVYGGGRSQWKSK